MNPNNVIEPGQSPEITPSTPNVPDPLAPQPPVAVPRPNITPLVQPAPQVMSPQNLQQTSVVPSAVGNMDSPQRQPKKSKAKIYIIIGIALGVLLLAVGAVLLLRPKGSKPQTGGSASIKKTVDQKTDVVPAVATDTRPCKEFVASDYDVIINGAPEKTDGMFATYKGSSNKWTLLYKYLFVKDSLAYDSPDIASKSILSAVRFGERFKDNAWQFSLRGSIAVDTAEAKQIATKRAQKVQKDLTDAGIPADRIIIKDPRMDKVAAQNYINIDDRYVQVVISANCK